MNATRPLTLLTGITLLGLGGSLIVRSLGSDGAADADPRAPDASVPYGRGARIEKAFTIACSAQDLYAYWRDLTNLPRIMSHLKDVEVIDELRSRWTAQGPAHLTATWEAEIVDDSPARRIAWRSVGGTVPNAGSVRFTEAPGGRGTELRLEMEWAPPGGPLGTSLAHLIGDDPGLMVDNDLRRFKATMEAGTPALNGTDVTR
jgi:uncharacterized membrane protein